MVEELNLISLKQVHKNFSQKRVLSNFNLSIEIGERIFIRGRNGLGKTTLLELISGQLLPDEGKIVIQGHDPFLIRDRIGYVPFRESGLMPNLTGEENLKYFLNLLKINVSYQDHPFVSSFLNVKAFQEGLKTKFFQMSSGMKRLFLLCCTLLHEPQIILLDEPFQNLDQENTQFLLNLIENDWKQKTIIIVDHRNVLEDMSFRTIDLEKVLDA